VIFDHVDLRVTDVDRVRTFYDAFLRPFGFRGRPQEDGTLVYFRLENRRVREAIAIIGDELHRPNATRLAFSAASRDDVDRIAALGGGGGAGAAGRRAIVRSARPLRRDRGELLRVLFRRSGRQPPRSRLPLTAAARG